MLLFNRNHATYSIPSTVFTYVILTYASNDYKFTPTVTYMYFICRVTLFFANNYLTEYRITMEF